MIHFNPQLMSCGECGEDTHRVFQTDKGYLIECLKCRSQTFLSVSIPKINLEWVEGSPGQLTVFESKNK